ncbi:transcription repressor OFP8-like [Impatiens glandulifera]|uniref:transcription repressor OFP8-like n=1 Tax=Impatiens glandulifera TaxID=253017 RepID=UPI001FB0541D|nr:transcription repressor OFP8-like [Impatiens glandulifera]
MENQNQSKLKLKISRMFRSSFGYCKSVSDVIERPPPPSAADQPHRHYQLIELFSPKIEPSRHTRRDKWSKFVESVDQNCSLAKDRIFQNKKVQYHSPIAIAPPVTPISPIKSFSTKQKNRKQKKHRKKRATYSMDKYYEFFSSSSEEDEEDDRTTATLFSSRSLSSDSSVSFRGGVERSRMRREGKAVGMNMMMNMMMPAIEMKKDDIKVKDSLMVVKKSKDPYSDFRNSMVEMIVEKQIFAAKDLENLLQTFLSLNSSNHHRVIVEVYTEIWETLFSNWS